MGTAYTWGITTSVKSTDWQTEAANALASKYGIPFIPRNGNSLPNLRETYHLDYIVTLDRNNRVSMEEPLLKWHPAMALPRLRRLTEGGEDLFLTAVTLLQGERILDCTLGLGTDAILAAWAVGEAGLVLGLEASPIIALLTEWGLAHEAPGYDSRKRPIGALPGRIQVRNEEALAYLQAQPDCSWDVVYFDPMFRAANPRSSGINSLRPLADHSPFTQETLAEALRVCRKRVVLKERWFSPLFQQLGADHVVRSKYGPVVYGVWERERK
ncbi:MAG: class I SAM-dependent methyltransferase [Clostridiales bacterium]|nr:class I SAM-dependent methyltransferase [Clostridiales bacterium]